ncbi:MAG: amino acid permease [Bacteroidia bacterium]|nr:amino acid permease [Bacteroidia bacterium]
MSIFRKKKVEDVLSASESQGHGLSKQLGVLDLTAFGIAAIIGAGIFSTIGKASAEGGPAVIFLFLFTALACGFAALSYAEFASFVPVSGSAYTYAYVAFGEIFAWIIGWALTLEYAIGNCTVAISWSDYFCSLLTNITGYELYDWLTMDYFTARDHAHSILGMLLGGVPLEEIKNTPDHAGKISGFYAWASAPEIFGIKIIFDAPALLLNLLITWLVYRGIKESKTAGNIMVLIKLAVVVLVIVVGVFYVDVSNWSPFMPNGIKGLAAGISAVFFAYIGFDAISTTAEECRNPQRDLPRGIIYSILICTVLYILIALVLTGMVSYKELNVADPLAYVFEKIKSLKWLAGVISVSAVVAMASVMLVFQLGQPRIWLSMSRDGLLPKAFARIHPKFKTPSFATFITGITVALCVLTMDMNMVTDICSAGTLFAFVMVCAGVMHLKNQPDYKPKFQMPYINGKWLFMILFVLFFILYYYLDKEMLVYYFKWESGKAFFSKMPFYMFLVVFGILAVLSVKQNYSLLPGLGLLSCLYMLSQLGYKNWLYFMGWLVLGLVIYFLYGYKNSKWKNALSS